MANEISKIKLPGSTTEYTVKDNSAITNITRNGTTFTATKRDGSTFTFTQQDGNTTYLLSADTTNNQIKLTSSSGTAQSITVPYATYASSATTVTRTETNPTQYTTYNLIWNTGSTGLGWNDGLSYATLQGTTSVEGHAYLNVGNNIATGTTGNKTGVIRLYSEAGGYAAIKSNSTITGNTTVNINASGTVGAFTSAPTSGQVVITDGTDGGIKTLGYTIAKSVPSNAVFTDTNNAVTQTATSTNANYEVLFSATADNTTRTEGARKNSNLIFNPAVGLKIGTSSQSAFPTTGIQVHDVRSVNFTPGALDQGVNFFFSNNTMPNSNWWSGIHVKGWTGAYAAWEIVGSAHNNDSRTTALYVRGSNTNSAWGSWRKIYDTSNPPTKSEVGLGNVDNTADANKSVSYATTSGTTNTAKAVLTAGGDVVMGTTGSDSDDSGDIVWRYGNGNEKARIWTYTEYTAKGGLNYRVYKKDGTSLYNGSIPLADGTGASGTWGISISGSAGSATSATTASKLSTNAGSATNPVYFTGGVPTACTYSLNKTVPSDAVFTDTNTTYTLSADTTNNKITLTPSSGSAQSITVPYATSAGGVAWGDVTGKPSTFTPASHTHGIADITWAGNANLSATASANNQEWSIDLNSGSYTGTYWHIWSGKNSKTILACYTDNNKVEVPNGDLYVTNGEVSVGYGIELGTASKEAAAHIDFHWNSAGTDYTARIWQRGENTVDLIGKNSSTWGIWRAASFSSQSSIHVKENVQSITTEDAKKLLQLRPVTFNYKNGGQVDQAGLIAEEVYLVMPKMVIGDINFDPEEPWNAPSIDYSKFTPYLIKMVQEQQKEIDELKEMINQ